MQATRDGTSSTTGGVEACHRLARLLGADGVAAVTSGSATVDDLLDGRAEGLVVFPVGEADAGGSARATAPLVVLDAIQAAAQHPDATFADVLSIAAEQLGLDGLAFCRERDGEILVSGTGVPEHPLTLPGDARAELGSLGRHRPLTDGTVRQLGLGAGVLSPHLSAAFAASDHPDVVVAGSSTAPTDPQDLALVGRGLSFARALIDDRDRAISSRLAVERQAWAARIHDEVTQAVTAAFLELRRLAERPGVDADAIAGIDETLAAIRASLFDLRGILFDLTRPSDAAAPVSERMRSYVRGVSERWKLSVETELDPLLRSDEVTIDPDALALVQQVIREAIANAAKHAGPAAVRVAIHADGDALVVEVSDDGRGFDPQRVPTAPGHLGISLLNDRVTGAGGTISIQTAPGEGTRVIARVPSASAGPHPTGPMPAATAPVARKKERDR